MSALESQVGGSHYKDMPIQPVEFITKNKLGFLEGNVVKYVCRHKAKNGRQDVEKAIHYLQLLLDTEYAPEPPKTPDGWIAWKGGARPVDGDLIVQAMYRDGSVSPKRGAGKFRWLRIGDSSDILAYRIVTTAESLE